MALAKPELPEPEEGELVYMDWRTLRSFGSKPRPGIEFPQRVCRELGIVQGDEVEEMVGGQVPVRMYSNGTVILKLPVDEEARQFPP